MQWATEQAYVRTRYNKDLSEAYVHHYAAGVPYRGVFMKTKMPLLWSTTPSSRPRECCYGNIRA
jgi:hypothetical protein